MRRRSTAGWRAIDENDRSHGSWGMGHGDEDRVQGPGPGARGPKKILET